jgi:hypothetical protein
MMLTMALRHTGASSQARPAMVLLLVLLSHLALMASPLHELRHESSISVPHRAQLSLQHAHAGADDVGTLPTRDTERAVDCALKAAPPFARVSIPMSTSELLPAWARLALDLAVPACLPRQGRGPPQSADPQALLQVFHL